MSDINRMMKTSKPSASEAKPIEKPDHTLNTALVSSNAEHTGGESAMPCSKARALTARAPPPAGRRPLFRR
jgi:hypothetical protein